MTYGKYQVLINHEDPKKSMIVGYHTARQAKEMVKLTNEVSSKMESGTIAKYLGVK